ncbi:hypothetical protein OHC33_010264 [Knufia fluminis]|uniref:Zn(2)-C6 fungal-type domain-containing protein n=1 Tax=Knufia fluminis TaxID=191047 RepID=A0AAN8EJT8_9EURO|nr:hypothetical protein OHC33_010264 [Knufia fluminis]
MAPTQAEKDAYKLMRRGTRACRECRRRKIKCIYGDSNDDICQECITHSRECIKQGVVRGSSNNQTRNVKVQVTRLESAVEKLAREKDSIHATASIGGLATPHSTPEGGEENDASLEKHYRKRSPIFSLFNNEILHQNGALEAYDNELSNQAIRFPHSNLSDKEKLLSTIANVPNIFQVLHFASEWWISWREQHFALRKTVGDSTLHDFVQTKLHAEDPVAVGLGLMAIAMALGQIRPGVDDLSFNLPVPANHIMNYILAAIDQVICDSGKYQAQHDSILLFMLRAKHHTENNQLRKSWLRIRQGITCAQAIGFGAPSSATDAVISNEEAENQRFIASIFEIDHLISMVLGFPYAKDPHFTDARAFAVLTNPAIDDESLNMRALRRIIAVTAAHINDRNAGGLVCGPFAESTQATLDMAASCMPPGWWSLVTQPLSGLAVHRYESVMVQLWFWTVQSYLHMPDLINPSDIEPSPRNRQLCLDGCRNLIRCFNHLRTEPAVSVYMCNCDDFQALVGSCILLVGVLQDASKAEAAPQSADISFGIDADLALIDEVKDIFRYRMHEQGGGISKQGLAVLEELTSFLYEDDVQNSPIRSNGGLPEMNININKQEKTIMLPYFGTIKVELTRKLPKRKTTAMQQYPMLTPPRSTDGSSGDSNSPSQYSTHDFTLVPHYDSTNGILWAPNLSFGPESGNSYATNDNACVPLPTPAECPIDYSLDSSSGQSIPWCQWENYMFDQELDQDWNPGLQWQQGLITS